MAKKESLRILWQNSGKDSSDYKVSLDEKDETRGAANYLWEKLSDRNKIGISTELDSNKNLVPCLLKDNKIVMVPDDGSADQHRMSIVVDSYNIVDSTDLIPLKGSGSSTVDYVFFPFQFSNGQIKDIIVQQAQNSSTERLSRVNLAIYANDVPGISCARLVWSSIGIEFDGTGKKSYWNSDTGTCWGPVIPDSVTIEELTKRNNFFYVVFGALGTSDGGYRILGYKNEKCFDMLSSIGTIKVVGKIPGVSVDEEFHDIFDYPTETNVSELIVPYISFEEFI